MGLEIWVGSLGWPGEDEEIEAIKRREFASVNAALSRAGLPTYSEPVSGSDDRHWYGRIGRWHHIQRVRWVAASVSLTGERPSYESGADDPDALDKYEGSLVHSGGFVRHLGPPTTGLSFDHLICHGDAEGFYVPVDFEHVISDDEIGLLGSSYRLAAECDLLAGFLEIPPDIPQDPDALNKAIGDPENATQLWQLFGDATWACQQLRVGARQSIRLGAALVFG